ncbi:MAG: glycosyltransferase family 4 protein [Candidatus Binataceae bacterium]
MGGAETYLDTVIPALAHSGHDLAYLCEVDQPSDREAISLPADAPRWCFDRIGAAVLDRLRDWRPDLIYSHGLNDPATERSIIAGRRAVFFAHNYFGACVSGTKTFAFPQRRACGRPLSWRCLLHYLPHRCGGLNPAVTWSLYRREMQRLQLLGGYSAILTAGAQMRREFIRQGFDASAVRVIPPPLMNADSAESTAVPSAQVSLADNELQILCAGRMVSAKGGEYLIRAMPIAAAALRRPLRLVFAGDGPARAAWERCAARMLADHATIAAAATIAVEFRGWLTGAAYQATLRAAHLIALPSLWQEPFGLSGLEAGCEGVPAAAFAVGGIPDWLCDGVNGHLAPGAPPTAAGLAAAIVECLGDATHYSRLRSEARACAQQFNLSCHLEKLTALFAEVAR